MRIAYGIDLEETDDTYYRMVERIAVIAEDVLVPGRYLVEALPVLRHLPSWFPGAYFKRFAADCRREIATIVNTVYEEGVQRMVSTLLIGGCSTS